MKFLSWLYAKLLVFGVLPPMWLIRWRLRQPQKPLKYTIETRDGVVREVSREELQAQMKAWYGDL